VKTDRTGDPGNKKACWIRARQGSEFDHAMLTFAARPSQSVRRRPSLFVDLITSWNKQAACQPFDYYLSPIPVA